MIIELVRSGRSVRFRALGASMWPAIPSRSLIELTPCRASALRVGQIAAFERDGQVVVHRVTQISAGGLHFAGDALPAGDGWVAADAVLGRARVIERRRLRARRPTRADAGRLWRAVQRRLWAWLTARAARPRRGES